MTHGRSALQSLILAAAVALSAGSAAAQVYKCTDGAGKTVYADAPCASGSAPLRLPSEPTKSTASPTACAQLKDEINRLRAQANRNAEHGRKESAESAARRQSLGKQYAARCAGISLSAPKAR